MRSYDYAKREGIEEVSWERFGRIAAEMAEWIAGRDVDAVAGIARGGLFPAAAVACALRLDLLPLALGRRESDRVVHEEPVWRAPIPEALSGRKVALIDEMADTGETLRLAKAALEEAGASSVVTAALVRHTWAEPEPDITGLLTDALVLFPWDRRVYEDGKWRTHPELENAIRRQERREGRDG